MLQKQISTYEDDMAKLSGKESDQAQANGELDNITRNKECLCRREVNTQ